MSEVTCNICGHGGDCHRYDVPPRCSRCPQTVCQDGPDGRRYRAMIGATSQLLGDVPMS